MIRTFTLGAVLAMATLAPLFAGAHGAAETAQSGDSAPAMDRDREAMMQRMQKMRGWEDAILGDPLHQEMESLMQKMNRGVLSEEEWRRLSGLIGKYPGPALMMHHRTMMQNMMSGMMGRMMGGGHAGAGMMSTEKESGDACPGYGMPHGAGGAYMALMFVWELILLGAAFAAGWFLARRSRTPHSTERDGHKEAAQPSAEESEEPRGQ